MTSHFSESNDELYNLSTEIFNLNSFTDNSDDLNPPINNEQYNAAVVQEELYRSSTVSNPLFNILMDSRAQSIQSTEDVEELYQALVSAEDIEQGNGAVRLTVISSSGADQRFMFTVTPLQQSNSDLTTALTILPVMGSLMPQRSSKPYRGRRGPYTRRNFNVFFLDID